MSRVFLSWSGERSFKVAEYMAEWLRDVIQAADPWFSARDIDRGAVWFSAIAKSLSETSVGVILLTNENKDAPWILFESGALAKGLESSRVCTFLIDLKPEHFNNPLAQFNHSLPTQDSLFALIRTINDSLSTGSLDTKRLEKAFALAWPNFQSEFARIISETDNIMPAPKPRRTEEILVDVLENSRSLHAIVRRIEAELDRIRLNHVSQQSFSLNALASTSTPSGLFELRQKIIGMHVAGVPLEQAMEAVRGVPSAFVRAVYSEMDDFDEKRDQLRQAIGGKGHQ